MPPITKKMQDKISDPVDEKTKDKAKPKKLQVGLNAFKKKGSGKNLTEQMDCVPLGGIKKRESSSSKSPTKSLESSGDDGEIIIPTQ